MVSALCKPRNTEGSREWIMSIPANPSDPDLVIATALGYATDACTALENAREEIGRRNDYLSIALKKQEIAENRAESAEKEVERLQRNIDSKDVVECGNCGRNILFGNQCVCVFEKEVEQWKATQRDVHEWWVQEQELSVRLEKEVERLKKTNEDIALLSAQLKEGIVENDDGTYSLVWTQEEIDQARDKAQKYAELFEFEAKPTRDELQDRAESAEKEVERLEDVVRSQQCFIEDIRGTNSKHEEWCGFAQVDIPRLREMVEEQKERADQLEKELEEARELIADCCKYGSNTKTLREELIASRQENDTLRKERDRLQELRHLDNNCVVCSGSLIEEPAPPHCIDCHPEEEHVDAWDEARAALTETETEREDEDGTT
jgi:phosphoserine phosphatase